MAKRSKPRRAAKNRHVTGGNLSRAEKNRASRAGRQTLAQAKRTAARAKRNAAQANRQAQRQGRATMRSGARAIAEARKNLKRTARELQQAAKARRSPFSKKTQPTGARKVRPKKPLQSFRIKKSKRKSPIRKALKRAFGTRSSYRRVKRRPLSPDLRRRVQEGLRALREGKSPEAAARGIGLPEARFRETLLDRKLARIKNGELIPSRRGRARMRFFSGGDVQNPLVSRRTATKIGRYMSAVSQFLPSGDLELLQPFEGEAISDVEGRRYLFETRPNVLYALNAEPEGFEEIYELVA